MDTPKLVESDVTQCIFAYQALSKPKIKGGPGAEATLVDGIRICTYFVCTKFDILNHDGVLISGGCRSAKSL